MHLLQFQTQQMRQEQREELRVQRVHGHGNVHVHALNPPHLTYVAQPLYRFVVPSFSCTSRTSSGWKTRDSSPPSVPVRSSGTATV